MSIFREYLNKETFRDRFKEDKQYAVDVIIPVIHTNELWEVNLLSIYREIPVNRLILGDGGCIDNSLKVAKKFPRVKILNHRKVVALGYSIKKLIEVVETPWFVYLHSDVYLPQNWFDAMRKNQSKYDWFECRQHLTALVDYSLEYVEPVQNKRPLSGSQMGRKEAFKDILPLIDDDYLYRNEDAIYVSLLRRKGFRYGYIDNVFHYHQIMEKQSPIVRRIKKISFQIEKDRKEFIRENMMEVKAIIKYTTPPPNKVLQNQLNAGIIVLYIKSEINLREFKKWIAEVNPAWLPYITIRQPLYFIYKTIYVFIYRFMFFGKKPLFIRKIIGFLERIYDLVFS